jgi:hypothetical protein
MSDGVASARELLGGDHPLVRVDETTTAVERQTLVCTAFLVATVAAAYPDVAQTAYLSGSAAAVDLALLALVGLLRRQRRINARNVIIERGPLHLPRVQLEMKRLADHRHRTKLARRLRRAAQDAEDWHSLLVASRPPVGILELLPHTALAREIAEHLDTTPANVRGIALADRLLDDGYASPLYAGDGCRLQRELRHILHELHRGTSPELLRDDSH